MQISNWLAFLVVLVTTGCSITPPITKTEDNRLRLSTTVSTPVGTGMDITAVSLCVLKRPGTVPPVANPVTGQSFEALAAAKPGPVPAVDDECAHHSTHIFASTPTGVAVITQTAPVVAGQLIQRDAAIKVAEKGNCENPNGCGNTTFNIAGAQAGASSTSNLNNTLDIKSTVRTGGGTSLCKGKTAKECASLAQ